jgi:magnesium transporter
VVRALLFQPEEAHVEAGGLELIEIWEHQSDAILWVDIEKEAVEVEREILEGFDLHPLAIEDALRLRHPPKLQNFGNSLFVLLRGLDADTDGIDFGVIQLAIFVTHRLLVTRHIRRSVSTNWLMEHALTDPKMFLDGPAGLMVHLGNRLVRRYIEILLAFEPRLEEIETEIFDKPKGDLLYELTRYKSKLREISRIASYHIQVSRQMRTESQTLIPTNLAHELTNLHDQVERTLSLSHLYYETAKDLTDGYIALSTHRLNRVMQILTVITVIFVPLTFVAGIYGMNFENMPELRSKNGYFFVIGTMFTIGAALLALFRRKGWV